MSRAGKPGKSGVIIDHCAKHGLWFDGGELHKIIAWIGDGGLARRDRARDEETRAEASAKRMRRSLDQEAQPVEGWVGPAEPRYGGVIDFIDGLLGFLLRAKG